MKSKILSYLAKNPKTLSVTRNVVSSSMKGSGALLGASVGALLGSVIPGIGTVAGAGLGGAIGLAVGSETGTKLSKSLKKRIAEVSDTLSELEDRQKTSIPNAAYDPDYLDANIKQKSNKSYTGKNKM